MSNFFERLEAQRRLDGQGVLLGAALGVAATIAFFRCVIDPSSFTDLAEASVGAALIGASIAAGVIEYFD